MCCTEILNFAFYTIFGGILLVVLNRVLHRKMRTAFLLCYLRYIHVNAHTYTYNFLNQHNFMRLHLSMSVTYETNRFETCPDYTSAGIVIICSVMLLSAVALCFSGRHQKKMTTRQLQKSWEGPQ